MPTFDLYTCMDGQTHSCIRVYTHAYHTHTQTERGGAERQKERFPNILRSAELRTIRKETALFRAETGWLFSAMAKESCHLYSVSGIVSRRFYFTWVVITILSLYINELMFTQRKWQTQILLFLHAGDLASPHAVNPI